MVAWSGSPCYHAAALAYRHPRRQREERAVTERGTVKWFNENRGYGFIRREKNGRPVYVHYADIAGEGFRTLSEGELVEFELVDGPRGPQATNVRTVPRASRPDPDGC